MRAYLPTAILLSAAVMLSGCSSVKSTLGIERNVPDEFAVIKEAPLTIPPDYNLRPPRPGAARPQHVDSARVAAQTIFGRGANSYYEQLGTDLSFGEKKLLEHLQTDKANPDIKMILGMPHTASGAAVDADAESDRPDENAQAGKDPHDGQGPVIEGEGEQTEGEKGFLDWLF